MPERALQRAGTQAWKALDAVRQVEGVSALQRLRELMSLTEQLEQITAEAVQQALDAGETWEAVGNATGLSKPGAHRRWAAMLKARRLLSPQNPRAPLFGGPAAHGGTPSQREPAVGQARDARP